MRASFIYVSRIQPLNEYSQLQQQQQQQIKIILIRLPTISDTSTIG